MGRVLHASYSGWFPFCIQEIPDDVPTGTGTDRPIGMSLEKAMKFFWVLRSFNISAPSLTFPLSLPIDFVPNIPENEEELLVCTELRSFDDGVSDSGGVGPNVVNCVLSATILVFPATDHYKIEIINGIEQKIFYPVIIFSCIETSAGPTTYVKNSATFKFNPADTLAFSLPFFDFGMLDFYTGYQGDGSVSVNFSNSSYHSYSGIYDKTTGELIEN